MMISFIPQALSLCDLYGVDILTVGILARFQNFLPAKIFFESNIGRSYYPSFIVIQEDNVCQLRIVLLV
jgi:hypothetical protein